VSATTMYMNDGLEDLSGSSSEEEEKGGPETPPPAEKKKEKVSVAALKRHGFKGGPSVMLLEEEKKPANWTWGNGNEHARASKESVADRESTRGNANEATEDAVKRGLEQAEKKKKLRKKEWLADKRACSDDKTRGSKKVKRDEGSSEL